MNNFITVNLRSYFNNKGISSAKKVYKGDFSGVGSSYPSDELPVSESLITIENVPFIFPDKEATYDNMDFYEQSIEVPKNVYNKIHVLGASDNGSFNENINLINTSTNNRRSVKLGLTEWVYKHPVFGEKVAFRTNKAHSKTAGIINGKSLTIWYQCSKILPEYEFNMLKFGDNPGIHIFSLTLEKRGALDETL